jgi:release factor glutamine methyltransferase
VRPAQVVGRAASYLERHGVQSPRPTAELLLASVLKVDRSGLYARGEDISPVEAKMFGRALCRRCVGTPLQHLTGEQGFRRLLLAVRPGVFVPRPETELVVDAALAVIDAAAASGFRRPLVADACTGSGAIALAIKDERPDARVYCTDVSEEAVSLVRENASRLGLDVDVRPGSLLDPLPAELLGSLDLVVANPPYVSPNEYEDLPDEVRADPKQALVGDPAIYERLFEQAARWLRPGGGLVVEVSETRGGHVSRAATASGFGGAHVLPDLAGRDRIVSATLGRGIRTVGQSPPDPADQTADRPGR